MIANGGCVPASQSDIEIPGQGHRTGDVQSIVLCPCRGPIELHTQIAVRLEGHFIGVEDTRGSAGPRIDRTIYLCRIGVCPRQRSHSSERTINYWVEARCKIRIQLGDTRTDVQSTHIRVRAVELDGTTVTNFYIVVVR